MKKKLFLLLLVLVSMNVASQTNGVFRGYIFNDEYKVYMDINLYDSDIKVDGQDIFGYVPGYLGALRDSRKWLITSVAIKDKNTAALEIVNDYGSEDLKATLSYNEKDGTYTFRQDSGSRIKIVVNRKWVKLPATMTLVPHKRMVNEW